jgi:hypothetical protein
MNDEVHKLRKCNSFAYKCYVCGNIAYYQYSRGVELKGKCGHKGSYFRFDKLDKLANAGYFGVKNLALGFIDKSTVVIEKHRATAIKYRSSDAFVLVEFSDGKSKWIDSFDLFWSKRK